MAEAPGRIRHTILTEPITLSAAQNQGQSELVALTRTLLMTIWDPGGNVSPMRVATKFQGTANCGADQVLTVLRRTAVCAEHFSSSAFMSMVECFAMQRSPIVRIITRR